MKYPLKGLSSIGLMPLALAAGIASATTVDAPTQYVNVDGDRIAYRIIGPDDAMPLLLLNRFRGTMDHWDPQLVDRLATRRRVVMFDQPGFARSGGTAPNTLPEFAGRGAAIIRTLGFDKVDVLGFSMGGTVALQLALDHPGHVRRLVIAGSGPGHVPGNVPSNQTAEAKVWQVATKTMNTDEAPRTHSDGRAIGVRSVLSGSSARGFPLPVAQRVGRSPSTR